MPVSHVRALGFDHSGGTRFLLRSNHCYHAVRHPMLKPECSRRISLARTLFLVGVLASLCHSSSVNLHQSALILDRHGQSELATICAEVITLRTHALTTSVTACPDGPSPTLYRFKRSASHLATLLPEKLSAWVASTRYHSFAGSTSLNYSSFSISRPQGRAPPRIA